ncbi:MAG: Uma2 family endonuclease [Solirubrobacteraceae bacterium]
MATQTGQRMTAQAYFATDERHFTQLIDGEVIVTEATGRHQLLAKRILFAFCTWTRAAPGRGEAFIPINVRMDEHNVFGPDISYLSESELPSAADWLYIDRPPSITVEVRSPSTWRYDIGTKKANYERQGCPELWLVDGEADTVLVFRRSARGAPAFDVALELSRREELSSPQLPGFSLALEALFAPLRPA